MYSDILKSFQFFLIKGLYISGARRSPPKAYINPTFLVVLSNLENGLILAEVVMVPTAVNTQRMFKAVNL